MNDNSLDRVKEIKGEMLMVWASRTRISRARPPDRYDAVTDAGVNFTWHEFNGQHAFLRDEGARYDPELARLCYGMAIRPVPADAHAGHRIGAASRAAVDGTGDNDTLTMSGTIGTIPSGNIPCMNGPRRGDRIGAVVSLLGRAFSRQSPRSADSIQVAAPARPAHGQHWLGQRAGRLLGA